MIFIVYLSKIIRCIKLVKPHRESISVFVSLTKRTHLMLMGYTFNPSISNGQENTSELSHPGLQSELQDNQGCYTKQPALKSKKKRKIWKRERERERERAHLALNIATSNILITSISETEQPTDFFCLPSMQIDIIRLKRLLLFSTIQ